MKILKSLSLFLVVSFLFCGCGARIIVHVSPTEPEQSGWTAPAPQDMTVTETVLQPETLEERPTTAAEPATAAEQQATAEETVPTEAPTTEITTGPSSLAPVTYGTCGRLDIPSVHIGIAVYYAELGVDAQEVVVNSDSAALFLWHNFLSVIADHNNQGFATLRKVQVGDVAVLSNENGEIGRYICTDICRNGTNTGNDLLNENGVSIENDCDSDLVMYTCNEDWQHITIVFWKSV